MLQILLKAAAFLFTFITVFSRHLTTSVNGEILTPQNLLPDVAINCGFLTNSTALDGRHWVGETPLLQPKGNSRATTSAGNSFTADPTPYFTARISSTYFFYSFQVNPGQKFVRLHFCPASYRGFQNSHDFFTVKANSFTLLQNYSASLAADALGVKYIIKEFCLNVNETGNIQISFFASQRSSKKIKNHAFVNGIEIISMPTGLYYTPDGSLGPPVVGHADNFYNVDNNTALELIHRLNVGGGSILPVEDTGMFRRWSEDANYLLGSFGFQQINYLMPAIEHVITSPFIAPIKVYQTSRVFRARLKSGEEHDFTWKMPVDLGFCYLLRLHFCYCRGEDAEGSPEDFSIFIQNVVAETQVNVVQLSGGNGIPVYRDYLVMMKGDKAEGKHDLLISLQSIDELVLGLLKGLEIFKLSNPDNSLASPNPSCSKFNSLFLYLKIRNVLVGFGWLNVVMTALVILLVMVNAAVYQVRQICEYEFWHDRVESAPKEPSCCHFSLSEILSATGNFNEALVIGKGGFGKVYKGLVYGRPEVLAIKRLKSDSKQGAREFWREIETLSKLRHIHLVPLIGYCNENREMILVYEYMPRGTIADNIYRAHRNGKEGVSLTWEQRLRICIGAARGIDYLHTGTQYGVIHRDVKDTNILLDENFIAKISDFGLSKQGTIAETQGQVTTKVKGTLGYLDPHYLATQKPSISSDIYAFGIVMLVVLSGRPAVEIKFFPDEHESLLACFRECMTKGEMKEIIDPTIQGEISAESLTKFTEAVENCLHHLPKKRPTMAQVVVFLEHALEKHQASVRFALTDETVNGQPYPDVSNQSFELQVAPIPEENVASFSVEGKEIQNADLHSKVVVLQPKEKDRNITHKVLWGRPWVFLKNIRKPTKNGINITPCMYQPREERLDLDIHLGQELPPTYPLALRTANHFSLKEIISATQNFSSRCLIGKGRFGDMYIGVISGGSRIVAIKRLRNYGAKEFQAEVELLSMLHYIHVVSLVGFCNERNELFLVYEYMARGSLASHIYRTSENNISLTWEQRIRICIGAARGLNYLHEVGVIHRDVNDHNIKLDENFVPKIYTIALSKLVNASYSQTHFSTVVARTNGYLDPRYFLTGQLVKASDVYSFGIVLLVVLSGRPAVDHTLPEEDQHLKLCFETCFENGDLDKIVDRTMEGRIPKSSFRKFVHLIQNCLHEDAKHRPVMTQVVANLEEVLDLAQEMPSLMQEFDPTDNIESPPALSTKKGMALRTANHFSLKEIISATQNFSSRRLIGKGRFGDMYIGVISGGSRIAAIKRLRNYGAKEFQAEVELLSMLHYIHVVSLVGFCNERNELFLVYEYMARGSLASHIYRTSGNNISLTWEQRIRICIGAARGLNYLHEVGVIHRDVNDHNIMLDENFVPKIYTIALSKLVNASYSQTHFSNIDARTYGYLDPHYFLTGQLVKASDVYSFGIVLLVVLSGRPAVDHTLPAVGYLKLCFETCLENGNLDEIVDRIMEGRIPKASFRKFVQLISSCLHEDPKHRPVMTRVVTNLEEVLDLAQEMPLLMQEFDPTDNIESSPALSTPQ